MISCGVDIPEASYTVLPQGPQPPSRRAPRPPSFVNHNPHNVDTSLEKTSVFLAEKIFEISSSADGKVSQPA